jgi:microcystin degradation protein MlrC
VWFPFIDEAEVPETVGASFDDLPRAIRSASRRVSTELKTARFDVDADGRPTSSDVVEAVQDATIAQLKFWADTGDENGAGAQSGGGSILSVSLPGGSGVVDARTKQEARVSPEVSEILRGCPGIDWEVQY